MASEKIKQAADIFAELMKRKMVDRNESSMRAYFEDMQVHELIQQFAKSFGAIILEGHEKIHLIAEEDTVFATSFTHLKEKYSDIENKKEFHLLCNILMIYLSEIDGNLTVRSKYTFGGLSFYRLEEVITNVYNHWKEKMEHDDQFEKKWAMNIREQADFWLSKDLKDDTIKLAPSMKNKFSMMKKALNLFQNEGLLNVIQEGDEFIIYAYPEFYERIEGVFHNYERYKLMRDLIVDSRQEKERVD